MSKRSISAVLFDLDGVFYEGEQAIAKAAKVAEWVSGDNIPHLFLTNTSSKPRSAIVDKLKSMDIFTDESHILTPAVATVEYLKKQSQTGDIVLFMPDATKTEFSELPIHKVHSNSAISAVVIGDLGEAWNFQILNQAFRFLMTDPTPKLISLGMTRYWRAQDGLRLDVAPFVAALQCATDVEPIVLGKPAANFYQIALKMLQTNANQTVMLGDDIRGDIGGAQQAGLQGILVKTGKFRAADLELEIQPDAILSSIAEFPEWWKSNAQ